jgi:adenine deaminase
MESLIKGIQMGVGKVKPDLVFKNGKIACIFSNELLEEDLAIHNDKIIGIGKYEGNTEIDLAGKVVCPGFLDGHIHMESSMLSPHEFCKAVIPKVTN